MQERYLKDGTFDEDMIAAHKQTIQFFASQNDFDSLRNFFANRPRDPTINAQNARKHTALYCASRIGNVKMVRRNKAP
jgi:hypothetical protein